MPPRASGWEIEPALQELLDAASGGTLTLADVLKRLGSRSTAVFLALFSVPFLLVIPLPGLSTIAGIPMAWLGWRLARGLPPWLPDRIARRTIPLRTLQRAVGALRSILGRIGHWLHPRWDNLVSPDAARRTHGLYIAAMALVLAIPMPPVFVGSNAIAAWPIFLLSLGLLERDGRCVLAAYLWLIPFTAYWLLFATALRELAQALLP